MLIEKLHGRLGADSICWIVGLKAKSEGLTVTKVELLGEGDSLAAVVQCLDATGNAVTCHYDAFQIKWEVLHKQMPQLLSSGASAWNWQISGGQFATCIILLQDLMHDAILELLVHDAAAEGAAVLVTKTIELSLDRQEIVRAIRWHLSSLGTAVRCIELEYVGQDYCIPEEIFASITEENGASYKYGARQCCEAVQSYMQNIVASRGVIQKVSIPKPATRTAVVLLAPAESIQGIVSNKLLGAALVSAGK